MKGLREKAVVFMKACVFGEVGVIERMWVLVFKLTFIGQ